MQPDQTPTTAQPAVAAAPAQAPVVDQAAVDKAKKFSLIVGGASIAIFFVGLFVGVASLGGVLGGAYAAQSARRANYTPGLALGLVGAILNLVLFLLAVLIK